MNTEDIYVFNGGLQWLNKWRLTMEIDINSEMTLEEIFELHKENLLRANSEYQRGLTWSPLQQQMFIDSLLRGYKAPAFYFHDRKLKIKYKNQTSVNMDIIDGQQRVNAICKFIDNGFSLLDPKDDKSFRFPNFVRNTPCPWAGKRFEELSTELQTQLLNHKIIAYEIKTENDNEIRDLFIRLQSGVPLTPQDKRDAWPGNFTTFVLTAGGKSQLDKYYGWPLFKNILKGNSEGRRRELAASTYLLFHNIRTNQKFKDINSQNIDQFYHEHVDFDHQSTNAKDFKKICDTIANYFQGKPKLVGHQVFHLVLLVDILMQNYPSGWQVKLPKSLQTFQERCDQASKANSKGEIDHPYIHYFWRYYQWTSRSSGVGSNIQKRHAFFIQEMINLLGITPKDPNRAFSEAERASIFYRDEQKCQHCLMQEEDHPVAWENAQIHHVIPHSEGGKTEIGNGALVHKDCHPRNRETVRVFREWWEKKPSTKTIDAKNTPRRYSSPTLPDGTKIYRNYKGTEFIGIIKDGEVYIENDNGSPYKSLSSAANILTGTSLNAWIWWKIKLPGTEEWITADTWRQNQQ